MNDEASALHADPARAFDGQYQLGAEIGAGALGVVYRGVDERLEKPVAIKVWHSRLDESASMREQYDAEARALTALDHPNVIAITDYGIAGEAPYLIMELLEGQTLEERLRAGALPAAVTQTFMQSVLRGLGYMHMRGVMHRNLKPDNVFLHKLDADSEQLKLIDLCLESLPANTNTNAGATQRPRSAYDPPELDAGTEPDGRSDVYAVGVMMLHMLSGREPTRELVRAAADSADLLENVLPTAAPEVRAFIARAVATERGDRFGNADQMLRALLELPTPWAGDPPGVVAAQVPAAIRLKSEPANAQLAGSAAADATVELPAADSHELLGVQVEPDADAADEAEEVVLGPIGLMAKLRAHKRLLAISGGLLSLAAAGGAVALVLSKSASPEQAGETAAEKHEQAGQAKSKRAKKAKVVPVEEEAEPDLEHAQPGAEHAQAEGPGHAQQVGGKEAKAPAPGQLAAGAEAHKAPTAESSRVPEAPAATKAPPSAASETTQTPGAVTAHGPAAAPSKPAAAVLPAAAASGKGEAQAEAPTPAPATAAVSGDARVGGATQVDPKAPTPAQIGAVRHIEPDKDEIRQMLALAITPKPRVAARDPWNIEVPGSLQALRDAIAKGEGGSAGNLKALRRYNSANPDDVYGHLLLAGFYANRGFTLDALDQYDMAYRIDPSSRGAPEMLEHALKMVKDDIAAQDATRFITRVYGREALLAIGREAQARDTSAAAARRLKQLQARISGGKRR